MSTGYTQDSTNKADEPEPDMPCLKQACADATKSPTTLKKLCALTGAIKPHRLLYGFIDHNNVEAYSPTHLGRKGGRDTSNRLGLHGLLAPSEGLVATVHNIGDQAGASRAGQGHIVSQPSEA